MSKKEKFKEKLNDVSYILIVLSTFITLLFVNIYMEKTIMSKFKDDVAVLASANIYAVDSVTKLKEELNLNEDKNLKNPNLAVNLYWEILENKIWKTHLASFLIIFSVILFNALIVKFFLLNHFLKKNE